MDVVRHNILTSLKPLWNYVKEIRDIGAPQALRNLLGDDNTPDVLYINLGIRKVHLLMNPEWVPEVLRTPDKFQKPSDMHALTGLFGKHGIFTSGYDEWKKQKETIRPHFMKSSLDNFGGPVQDETEALIKKWKDQGGTEDLYEDFRDYSLQILFKTLFKYDVEAQSQNLKDSIDIVNGFMMKSFMNPLTWIFNRHVGVPAEVTNAIKQISDIVDEICGPHYFTHHEGELASDILKASGYYEAQTDAQRHDARMQTKEEIWQLVFAGYETTASSLTWAVAELGRMPEEQQAIREEITDTIGDDPVTVRNMNLLRRQNQYMAEVLRVYPTLHTAIPRKATEDVEIADGYKIAKGEYAVIPVANLQTDPRYFNNPDEIDMANMEKDAMRSRPRYSYMPFLAGPHACIGRQMFYQEAISAISEAVRNFDIKLDTAMPKRLYKSSVVPDNGCGMIFTPIERVPEHAIDMPSRPNEIKHRITADAANHAGDSLSTMHDVNVGEGTVSRAPRCPFH